MDFEASPEQPRPYSENCIFYIKKNSLTKLKRNNVQQSYRSGSLSYDFAFSVYVIALIIKRNNAFRVYYTEDTYSYVHVDFQEVINIEIQI